MHRRSPLQDPQHRRLPWLRRADQAAVALLVAAALVSAAAYWYSKNGRQPKWIEIDRAAPRTYRFEVDLNRADWPELALLPGLGPTLAQRIVAYRNEHGSFSSESELLEVSGIGPATLAAIRPYLTPLGRDSPPLQRAERSGQPHPQATAR